MNRCALAPILALLALPVEHFREAQAPFLAVLHQKDQRLGRLSPLHVAMA